MNKPKNLSDFPQLISLDIELGYSQEYPNSAYMDFDFEAYKIFGSKARIPVKLTVDGHIFRSSLAPMGGRHMMVFNHEMRVATGYKAGDLIHIILERDTEPRIVDIPDDVKAALEKNDVLEILSDFSYYHQKEFMDWINNAKKQETRLRRIAKLITRFKEKA